MAGTTTCMPNSFRKELLIKGHSFAASGGDAFKLFLIKVGPAGTYNKSTANYSDITGNSDEVASGGGYTTAGKALTNIDPSIDTNTAITDFPDASWTSATFSTTAAGIANTSNSNKIVSLHDFGGTQSVSAGTFTIIFPAADASNAILRLA